MLKEMPEKLLASGPAQDDGEALHGVTVRDIDADARRQFDLPATLQGALISKIDSDSAAYDAGLRKGDVIQEINRQPIASAEHQPSIVEISAAGAELRSAPLATP